MTSLGRRVFTRLCEKNLNNLLSRIIIARSMIIESNAESTKSANPTVESEKTCDARISVAMLKEFSNPLVIENVEPPKRLQDDEVNINFISNKFSE